MTYSPLPIIMVHGALPHDLEWVETGKNKKGNYKFLIRFSVMNSA